VRKSLVLLLVGVVLAVVGWYVVGASGDSQSIGCVVGEVSECQARALAAAGWFWGGVVLLCAGLASFGAGAYLILWK